MTSFRGIFNDNGIETDFRIFINLEKKENYISDFYMNDIRFDVKINGNSCTILTEKNRSLFSWNYFIELFSDNYEYKEYEQTNYELVFKKFGNEIIVVGKEINSYNELCYCPFFSSKPKFFVGTNKEDV